jgi:hypothetical protein
LRELAFELWRKSEAGCVALLPDCPPALPVLPCPVCLPVCLPAENVPNGKETRLFAPSYNQNAAAFYQDRLGTNIDVGKHSKKSHALFPAGEPTTCVFIFFALNLAMFDGLGFPAGRSRCAKRPGYQDRLGTNIARKR